MNIQRTKQAIAHTAFLLVLMLAAGVGTVWAQSTDVAWPTPVRTNEVRANIAARDIGDPRVTDHFYAFTGMPGDVLITVDSRNMNGDVDVFTFNGLRPLLKFTVYAGSSSPITKSIYLRKQEDLILRVEGRTPNDDDAVYRLRFGGAFEPIISGPLAEHEDTNPPETTASSSKGGRRVSSAGATIDQPPTEVADAPKPEPTPEVVPAEPKVATTKSPRGTRPRRPATRRTRPVEKPKPAEETAKTETEDKGSGDSGEKPAVENSKGHTAATPSRKPRNTRGSNNPPTASQEPEPSGPRLIIETNDGTLVDKYMSSVRRVTVENGQVVVIGKDGKVQRIPLVNVVRMTIAQ